MDIIEKMMLDGYVEVNGSSEFSKITTGASKTNFHRVVHPVLYEAYNKASTEEEQKSIKDITPPIGRAEYASATVRMFIERVDSDDYKITMGETSGVGYIFHNNEKKTFFSISNTQLMLHLTLFSERLGVPSGSLNLRYLAKEIMKNFAFRVRIMDLKNNS